LYKILLLFNNFVVYTLFILADKRESSMNSGGATEGHPRKAKTLEMTAEIIKT
jgi:hypothetical protein